MTTTECRRWRQPRLRAARTTGHDEPLGDFLRGEKGEHARFPEILPQVPDSARFDASDLEFDPARLALLPRKRDGPGPRPAQPVGWPPPIGSARAPRFSDLIVLTGKDRRRHYSSARRFDRRRPPAG